MSGRPLRNRFRFRLLGLVLLALIGGLGSCLGGSGEPELPLAGPTVSADPVVPATTTPSTARSTAVTETTPPSATTRTRVTTTSATPRRNLVPDVDRAPVPAPPSTTRSSAREEPAEEAGASVYYQNCAAVQAAGAAPIRRGDPGYRPALDRDGDGQGCAGD